jgi:ribosome biogenesis protein Nip4
MMVSHSSKEELNKLYWELEYYGVMGDALGTGAVMSRRGRYVEVFLLGPMVGSLLADLSDISDDPIYMGLKLGEISKGRFRPSLEFGSLFYPIATRNKLVLDGSHAQMFLYGRDIFKENLSSLPTLGRKLVGNEGGGFLGLGIFNGRYLANIIDKGAYLRKYD